MSGRNQNFKDQGYQTLTTTDPIDHIDPLETHWTELIEWKLIGLNSLNGRNQKFKDQGYQTPTTPHRIDPIDPLETHWTELIEWKLIGLNSLSGRDKIQRPRLPNPNHY